MEGGRGGGKLIHGRGCMAYLSVMSWNGDLRESVLWSLSSSVVGGGGGREKKKQNNEAQ